MKRIMNICLLLTFHIGYLQWGKGNSIFIFQAEAAIFSNARNSPGALLHPFVLIPFCGQLIILYCIFNQKAARILNLTGLACLSLIMLFLFFIGITVPNMKILCSAIPFIIAGTFVLRYNWNRTSI